MLEQINRVEQDSDMFSGPLGLWTFPLVNAMRLKMSQPSTPETSSNYTDDVSLDTVSMDEPQREEQFKTNEEPNSDNMAKPRVSKVEPDSITNAESIQLLASEPVLPEQKIDNPYQTANVPNNGELTEVLNIEIDKDEAAIIKQIANDWYEGMEFEIVVDGIRVEKDIERQVAPTDDPQEANILARETIVWRAINEGTEDRTVSAVADGVYIPAEIYDDKVDEYQKQMMG